MRLSKQLRLCDLFVVCIGRIFGGSIIQFLRWLSQWMIVHKFGLFHDLCVDCYLGLLVCIARRWENRF